MIVHFSSLSAFLTLSIISALLCLPLIIFASIGLSDESNYHSYYHDYDYVTAGLVSSSGRSYTNSGTACYGFQIFVALVQAGIAIATSAMSCRIICCSKQDNSGGVIYSPGQIQPQQFMMVAPNQFSNSQQFVTVPSNQVAPFTQVASPVAMQQNGKILYWLWKCIIAKNINECCRIHNTYLFFFISRTTTSIIWTWKSNKTGRVHEANLIWFGGRSILMLITTIFPKYKNDFSLLNIKKILLVSF